MMRKYCLLSFIFLLWSIGTQAQFKKLINKAKNKAIEAVVGGGNVSDSDQIGQSSLPADSEEQEAVDEAEAPASMTSDDADAQKTEKPKEITFPHTGETVLAMHAVFAPMIDGDIEKITHTPAGKYGISLARQKGLEGSDMDIFRQLLKPENSELMEEISDAVQEKFPHAGEGGGQEANGSGNSNPAHGGFSAPSIYFEYMVGRFNVWMTDRYVKWATKNDHFTMAAAFGVNVVSITDLQKRMAYNIGSVLGVNYTMVEALDSVNRPYGPLAVLPLFKEQYQGIDGIKIEPGQPEKYGEYNCSTIKIIVPVRPYMDKQTHQMDNSLLALHDILSGRDDMGQNNGKGHWDPAYQIIYKGYYSHDVDKYLPAKVRDMVQHIQWKQGMGVGAAITDEKGNSANFRLVDITTDNKVDQGEFQVPDEYPVMTQAQLNEAIKKQFSLKNLLLRGSKNDR